MGRIIHLTGRSMEVVYEVRNQANGVEISMVVEGYGPFAFDHIRATRDSLHFTWEPSFELACSLARLDDGVFQGACMDPWGGFGGIVMAPPGSDVDAIPLHAETIESIAGWTEAVPSGALPSLSDTYPLGQNVVVHGRRANLVVAGEGPVTVVLEAGLGDNLTSWEQLQKLLAQHVRVVSYDRAGLGYSEPTDAPRSPEQIAVELRGLLREAGIAPPYVLVGHAEGALYVRRFAALYGASVKALVLVDPHLESQHAMWQEWDRSAWLAYWERRKAMQQNLPAVLQAEFSAYAAILESGSMPGMDRSGDIPVTVLTSARASEAPRWVGEGDAGRAAWIGLHRKWTAERSGTHIVVHESGAYIHQEQAVRVLQVILTLLR